MKKLTKKSKIVVISALIVLFVVTAVYAGSGKCGHGGCHCSRYVSAHNGGKCVCGHWDYVHR